jgi:phenylalanyl-tRNA synthetase alpha chain
MNAETIQNAKAEALQAFGEAKSAQELEQLRVKFLGKKGLITQLSRGLRDVEPDMRKQVGQAINEAKTEASKALDDAKARLTGGAAAIDRIDVTLPGRRMEPGTIHPLNQVWRKIEQIFMRMGFTVEEGPEVETDWYNFTALNFPPDHPARDEHDTIFTDGGLVMRTHTSPVQIRVMERQKPPIRMICPGWAYRNDTIDATHSPMFSQVEGLLVDERVTFGDLKGVLSEFISQLFGRPIVTRFRPGFFPFTEPSAEMDIQCFVCEGEGRIDGRTCRVCGGGGWKEILGSGMVDVNVLEKVGVDPEKYTGFAFGMGIERISMFLYGIDEIRNFFEGDLRFLRQF